MESSDNTAHNKKEGLAIIWKSILAYGIWTALRLLFTKISVLTPTWEALNNFVASNYVSLSAKTLQFFGYDLAYNSRNILLDHQVEMYVGNHCLGISAMVIFLLIINFLSGRTKVKVLYSLFGLTVIFLVNWFRIVGLALMLKHGMPGFFHFNHSYTYLILVYGIIFFLIVTYDQRFSKR